MEQDESKIKLPEGLPSEKLLNICSSRTKRFDQWFTKQMDMIKDNRNSFKNIFDAIAKSSTAFPVPITYGNVETIFARLSSTIFGTEKTVDAIRVDGVEEDNEKRQRIENFQNQEIRFQALRDLKGKNLVKSTLIDGIGIWRSTWKQTSKEYSRAMYDDGQFQGRTTKGEPTFEEVTLDDGTKAKVKKEGDDLSYFQEYWTFEPKTPENCGWEPSIELNVHNSPWFYEKSRMSLNELLEWQEEGRVEGIGQLLDIVPRQYENSPELKSQYEQSKNGNVENPFADDKCYEVVEWWGKLAWEERLENGKTKVRFGNYHWFVVEGKILIKFEDNDLLPRRHPYYSCPAIIDPMKAMGLSVSATTKGTQRLLDRLAGKQVDLVDQASNIRTYYGSRSGLDGRTSFTANNGLIPVKDVNQIKESTPSVAAIQSTQGLMNWLVGLMREISAANEQAQGVSGADTATEFKGLLAAAGSRFQDIADTMQIMINCNLAQECYWNYKENGIAGQMFVRDGDQEGQARALLPEDFEGDYEFIPASLQSDMDKEKSFVGDVEFLKAVKELEMIQAQSPVQSMEPPKQFDIEKYLTEVMLPKRQVKNGPTYFKAVEPPPMPGMGMGGPMGGAPMGPEGPPVAPPMAAPPMGMV